MSARTALVVEDDKAVQGLLRDLLEREGFQVLVEKDGDWALKSLERRLPDVLITDALLPTLSGFDLLGALREMPGGPDVPSIMVSGIYRGRRHQRTAMEKLGAVAYLQKPFNNEELLGAIQEALGDDYPGASRVRKRRPPPLQKVSAEDPLADAGTKAERKEVESEAEKLASGRTARGNLKHKPFGEVLSQLYRWKTSGALLLKKDRIKKIVYLKEGYPIFVKSNLLSECLGRVLVRERIITEEECAESLTKMKEKERQQGTVLIEMGCISPHNLVYGLQLQLEEKLFEIFGWSEGEYQFSSRIDIPSQAVHLDMSLATIIYEGVRRTHDKRQLEDRMAPFLDSYLGVHEDPAHRFQEISLEADERRLVGLIDGRRTVGEVVKQSGLEELTALQLIYALMAAEMVHPRPRRARRKDTLLPQPAVSERPPPLKKRKKAKASSAELTPARGEPSLAPSTLDEVPVEELRKRLGERARSHRRQNHFEVLGVSKSAGPDEVRRAYHALMRELHPDRLRSKVPADARDLAEQISARITVAWEVLSDAERRAGYEKTLQQRPKGSAHDDVGRILKAESHFRQGTRAIGQEDWEQAEASLLSAIELYPDEGEFFSHLGWVMFCRAKKAAAGDEEKLLWDEALDEAEARIREGIQKNPQADKGYLFLGQLLKGTGRETLAVEQFEKAIHCNPDCVEALEELQLVRR